MQPNINENLIRQYVSEGRADLLISIFSSMRDAMQRAEGERDAMRSAEIQRLRGQKKPGTIHTDLSLAGGLATVGFDSTPQARTTQAKPAKPKREHDLAEAVKGIEL